MNRDAQAVFEEMLKHEFVGRGFNIVCKCGYVGKEVSKKNDFERHVATELTKTLLRFEGDYLRPHEDVTRVTLVDERGIAYETYNAVNVVTSIQDEGHTLKVFLERKASNGLEV